MRLKSPSYKSIDQLRQRLFSSATKAKATAAEKAPTVGEAPFPLRLVYTYRSPSVELRHNAGKTKQTSPWVPLGLILGTNVCVWTAWNKTPSDQDRDVLKQSNSTYLGILNWEPEHTASADAHADFMRRHFTASVENLVSGRLHTLITAGFSQSDFWHLGGNMFALVLFGYRSCAALGPIPFIGLYLAGSFAASSAHIMHNLYNGKTDPSLTSAELRCAMRNALREVNNEMRPIPPKTSWGLPFMGSRQAVVATPSLPSSSSTQSWVSNIERRQSQGGNKNGGDDDDDLDFAERIGRFMAGVGVSVVDLVRKDRAPDNSEGMRNQNGDDDLKHSESEEDINRRLEELRRNADNDGSDLREMIPRKTPKKSWLQRTAEERNRRLDAEAQMEEQRQAAALEVAGTLVRHWYGSVTDTPSLGASGAVMAITNGSVLLFPLDRVVRAGVNLSLPISAAIYTFSDLAGFVYPDETDNVDHTGHLAGAGTGLMYVWLRWASLARAGVGCPGVYGALPIIAQWRKSGLRL